MSQAVDPNEPWRYTCPECGHIPHKSGLRRFYCQICGSSWDSDELIDNKRTRETVVISDQPKNNITKIYHTRECAKFPAVTGTEVSLQRARKQGYRECQFCAFKEGWRILDHEFFQTPAGVTDD